MTEDAKFEIYVKQFCIDMATMLDVKNENGEEHLDKDVVLEAAKAFYEWIMS